MKAMQNTSVWEDPKQRRSRSVLTCGEKLLHVNSEGELDVKGGEPKTSVGASGMKQESLSETDKHKTRLTMADAKPGLK